MRRVVCAAVRMSDIDHSLVLGPRHWDETMHKQCAVLVWLTLPDPHEEQGFIDQFGVFMDRQEAWKVAEAAGQIIYRCGGDDANGGTLYSENLY